MKELAKIDKNDLEALMKSAVADFCNGFTWMFEKRITASHASTGLCGAAQLKETCSGIIAVNRVAFHGAGEGTYYVILDKAALFTLGGMTVMQPLPRIKEQCQKGNEQDAKTLADAVGEIGNLIDGSFCKILRDGNGETEGLGEGLETRLQLPVPVGKVDMGLDPAVAKYQVLTYKLEIAGVDPFFLRVAIPSAAE